MQNPTTSKTRLFSPEALVPDSEMWLTGEQANYVTGVLRLKTNHKLVIFDGKGGQFLAVIKEFTKDRVLLHLGCRHALEIESPLAVHLVQGISRGGRMDVVVRNATELGVCRIIPVITEFSVVKLDAERAAKRHQHWLKVSRSACEQCGRNTLPQIDMPQGLDSWLAGCPCAGATRIMLDPGSSESISALPAPDKIVELLVGAEGGFSDTEYGLCKQAGFTAVSLGPRILRTETAALAAIAVLQALWGDLTPI